MALQIILFVISARRENGVLLGYNSYASSLVQIILEKNRDCIKGQKSILKLLLKIESYKNVNPGGFGEVDTFDDNLLEFIALENDFLSDDEQRTLTSMMSHSI